MENYHGLHHSLISRNWSWSKHKKKSITFQLIRFREQNVACKYVPVLPLLWVWAEEHKKYPYNTVILTSVFCDGNTLFCIKLCGSSESKCVRLLDFSYKCKKKQWRDEKKTRKSQSKAPIKSSTLIKWVECVRHGSLYGDKKWFCDQGSQKGYWKWHIFIYAIGFRVRFFNPHYRSVICVYSTQRCALGISVSMCHFTVLVKRKRLITFVSYVLQIGGKTMHSHLMSDIKSNKINTKCCPTQYQAK